MNYWIFKANPAHYDIDGRLLDPDPEIAWQVTRYHDRIQKGDTVFIWRSGTPRGICAVMIIDDCPYMLKAEDFGDKEYMLPAGRNVPPPEHWAKGHFVRRFPVIEANIIKKIEGLELFSFFSAFQQATNFSITRPEGTILLEFIQKYLAGDAVKKREAVKKPEAKVRRVEKAHPGVARKSSPGKPTKRSSNVELLQCEACGRYVVKSDTEKHVREAHSGHPVEWKKVK